MKSLPDFSSYSANGLDELCLVAGPDTSPKILLVPPLFDEMNRMRRMMVQLMDELGSHGIGSALPDLPGTNESLFPEEELTLGHWQQALASCAKRYRFDGAASFRGGALLTAPLSDLPQWQLAPVRGANLLRTMMRTRLAADKESGRNTTLADLQEIAAKEAIQLAGHVVSPALFNGLHDAMPATGEHCRVARLEGDSKPCDVALAGKTLWLRAEPDEDPALSAAIATDIADWIRQ